jgi:small subunit ribosomal protein S21
LPREHNQNKGTLPSYYYFFKQNSFIIPGPSIGVKVIDGNVEHALRRLKRKVKESGIIQAAKRNKQYYKPSAIKRLQKQKAIMLQKRDSRINSQKY